MISPKLEWSVSGDYVCVVRPLDPKHWKVQFSRFYPLYFYSFILLHIVSIIYLVAAAETQTTHIISYELEFLSFTTALLFILLCNNYIISVSLMFM